MASIQDGSRLVSDYRRQSFTKDELQFVRDEMLKTTGNPFTAVFLLRWVLAKDHKAKEEIANDYLALISSVFNAMKSIFTGGE